MSSENLTRLAQHLAHGEVSLDVFLRELARPKTADLTEVQLDLDRQRRCGYPEVIFGEDKPVATLEKLIQRMLDEGIDVLATRVSPDAAVALTIKFPTARYNPIAKTLRISLTQPVPSGLAQDRIKTSLQPARTAQGRHHYRRHHRPPRRRRSSRNARLDGHRRRHDSRRRRRRPASASRATAAARQCRCGHRRRRHGRRTTQRRRRPRRLVPSSPSPRASDTAPAAAAWPPCSACSIAAPPMSPSSTSTPVSKPAMSPD